VKQLTNDPYPEKNNQQETVLVGNEQLKENGLFKAQGVKAFESNLLKLWTSDPTLGWKYVLCLPNENIYFRSK
jgi:hypothetical protein